eukprot:35563_1
MVVNAVAFASIDDFKTSGSVPEIIYSGSDCRLQPISRLYKHFAINSFSGLKPEIVLVDTSTFPSVPHKLLVHSRTMTETLASHYKDSLEVSVLESSESSDNVLARSVIIHTKTNSHPVEVGMLEADLGCLPSESARNEVRERRKPFGAILKEQLPKFRTGEQIFFAIKCDQLLSSLLKLYRPNNR